MCYKVLYCVSLLLSLCGPIAFASAAPPGPAQAYLSQAAATVQQIALTGDQSAVRRMISQCLAAIDTEGALQAAAAIARPSDTARAAAALATALAPKDRKAALEVARRASQLLARIPEKEQRLQEQRLFVAGIAFFGADAPPLAAELPEEEARSIVVASLAASQPTEAAKLAQTWKLDAPRADRARAALADALAPEDAAQAIEVAMTISDPRLREAAMLRLAAARPPEEAEGLARAVRDPVTAATILAQGAARRSASNMEEAEAMAKRVEVAPASALAVVAAGAPAADQAQAVESARRLPSLAREWAIGQVALAAAAANPGQAEAYLAEIGCRGEMARLVLGRMASADTERAARLARTIAVAEERDAALAEVAAAAAPARPEMAKELLWEVRTPALRTRVIEALAPKLAERDLDAATSLLGLVTEEREASRILTRVAMVMARRDPAAARGVLAALPADNVRASGAFAAAREAIAAGKSVEEAIALAELAVGPDLARRWLLADIARSGATSAIGISDAITDPYLRALALVDAAAGMVSASTRARPCPERAYAVRPIVEWEGMQ